MEAKRVSVVIPVYNNATTIRSVCEEVTKALEDLGDHVCHDFVIVDDGSRDKSWAVLKELRDENPQRYTLIRFTRNFGQIAALLAGYSSACGHAVISMSADGQDPAELTADLVRAWLEGQRLVVGARVQREDGLPTRLVSGFAWRLLERFAVPDIPTGGFDFFLMDRCLCDFYIKDPENNIFLQGRLLYYGIKPFMIPYTRLSRREGKSQSSFTKRLKYFVDGFVAYSYLPLRLVTLAGIFFFFFSLSSAFAICILVFAGGTSVPGWASLMVVTLFLQGAQMLALGVLGEYLWRNLEQTRKRPNYLIEAHIPAQADGSLLDCCPSSCVANDV